MAQSKMAQARLDSYADEITRLKSCQVLHWDKHLMIPNNLDSLDKILELNDKNALEEFKKIHKEWNCVDGDMFIKYKEHGVPLEEASKHYRYLLHNIARISIVGHDFNNYMKDLKSKLQKKYNIDYLTHEYNGTGIYDLQQYILENDDVEVFELYLKQNVFVGTNQLTCIWEYCNVNILKYLTEYFEALRNNSNTEVEKMREKQRIDKAIVQDDLSMLNILMEKYPRWKQAPEMLYIFYTACFYVSEQILMNWIHKITPEEFSRVVQDPISVISRESVMCHFISTKDCPELIQAFWNMADEFKLKTCSPDEILTLAAGKGFRNSIIDILFTDNKLKKKGESINVEGIFNAVTASIREGFLDILQNFILVDRCEVLQFGGTERNPFHGCLRNDLVRIIIRESCAIQCSKCVRPRSAIPKKCLEFLLAHYKDCYFKYEHVLYAELLEQFDDCFPLVHLLLGSDVILKMVKGERKKYLFGDTMKYAESAHYEILRGWVEEDLVLMRKGEVLLKNHELSEVLENFGELVHKDIISSILGRTEVEPQYLESRL
jgi:hypothetical protein